MTLLNFNCTATFAAARACCIFCALVTTTNEKSSVLIMLQTVGTVSVIKLQANIAISDIFQLVVLADYTKLSLNPEFKTNVGLYVGNMYLYITDMEINTICHYYYVL